MTRNLKSHKPSPPESESIRSASHSGSSAEDLFVAFMSHESFQLYTALPLLRSEHLRAIYAVAELARQRAETRTRRTAEQDLEETHEAGNAREQQLRVALQTARKRLKSLRQTLRQRESRIAALEGRTHATADTPVDSAYPAKRPITAPRIPSRPVSPKTPSVDVETPSTGW